MNGADTKAVTEVAVGLAIFVVCFLACFEAGKGSAAVEHVAAATEKIDAKLARLESKCRPMF